MYCRMCGKLLDDTDRHCRYCGTATGFQEIPAEPKKPIEEEVVFNPPYESDEKQSLFQLNEEDPQEEKPEENLKEFISENEIEERKKQEDGTSKPSAEFTWNVHEFPTKKKTEDIEFNWKLEEFGQPEQKVIDTAAFEEELFQEIRDEATRIKESNIDRFFTFSKKNEEFQELLDREYEKFNRRPETIAKEHTDEVHTEEMHTEEPEESGNTELQIVKTERVEEPIPEEVILEEVIPEVILEEVIPEKVISEDITADVTEEINDTIPEEAAESDSEIEIPETVIEAEIVTDAELPETEELIPETVIAEAVETIPDTTASAPKAEHLQEMAQARALFFGEELIRDNDAIIKKLAGSETAEEAEIEEVSEEETANEEVPEMEAEPKATKEKETAAWSGKTTKDYVKEEAEQNLQNIIQSKTETTDEGKTDEVTVVSEESESKTANPLEAVSYIETEEEEVDEKERRRNRIGKTVLVIIGIILVLEISILGIRYIAPNSSAGKALNTTQIGVIDTVTGWFDSIKDKLSGNDSNNELKQEEDDTQKDDPSTGEQQPQDIEEDTPAPDPNPMADKAALVATQLGNNANIQQVKANDTLAYQEGRDYGLADINQSKPITNNVWMTPEEGEPVYYDRSIVGTIIAFDSQWIDYVHGTNKSILDLLKKDSEAYNKTVRYSKIGKVKETFKLLEIGEIRQGAQGFYIWVHEEIQITEQGKTVDKKYNWIYYLEPVDGKMNIVNYFNLNN